MNNDKRPTKTSLGEKIFLVFSALFLNPILALVGGRRMSLSSEKNREQVDAIKAQSPGELAEFVNSVLSDKLGVKEAEHKKGLISELRFPKGVVINAIEDMEYRYDFPIYQDDLDEVESIEGITELIVNRIKSS